MAWLVRRPAMAVLVLMAFLTPLVIHIGDLRVDTSAEGLLASGDPRAELYDAFRADFGSDTLTVVVVRAPGGRVFSQAGLELVSVLSEELEGVEGVSAVKSLATVSLISGDGGFISNQPLIEELPSNEEELAIIKERALASTIVVGSLVSADGSTAAINVLTEQRVEDEGFNLRFVEQVDEIIEAHRGDFEVFQIGAPISELEFSRNLDRDQRTLIPWSAAALLLFLLLAFRSVDAVVIPMATGGLSIAATLGFMAWMGYPVNVVTALVPSILIAVGCTEDVHMLSRYRQELRAGRSKLEAIHGMALHSALPIALTSLTTVLGFATLAVNKIVVLKHFGIVSSFGLVANFVITVTVVPTLLRFLPTPSEKAASQATERSPGAAPARALVTAARRAMGFRRGMALVTSAVVLLAVAGCFRLLVNTDFTSYFREDSVIRTRVAVVNEELAGAHTVNILVDAGEEEGLKRPEVVAQIAALQDFLAASPDFNKSVSVADFLAMMHRELNRDDPEAGELPGSEQLVAQYLLLLDEDEMAAYVDEELRVANVVAWHGIEGSAELDRVLSELRSFIDTELSKDLKINFTGEWVLINSSADAMVAGQVQSLALALVAVFIIMSALFLSLKAGAVAMVANILPIVLNFGVMGWLGIPLNTGTCMVAAIALGIAVDDTIHFMVRYQRELRETDSQEQAMARTLDVEGEPIFLTSTALTLGFGVLVMSSFNPTMHFGILAALVMLFALLADLFVNPMVLLSVQLITLWDFLRVRLDRDITKTSPIFRGLSTSQAKKIVLLGSVRTVDTGETIVRQGEEGHEMYLIIAGSARVILERDGESVELSALGDGDVLGEMALVGGGVRSATVVAAEPTDLLRIDEASLDRIRRRFPRIASKVFMNLARVLGRRLRSQNLASVASRT